MDCSADGCVIPRETYFVLVGGDAKQTQGCAPRQRELFHTSLCHVGRAYAQLRDAGVPRSRIITIVQLHDYLQHLPPRSYPRSLFESECARLLAEGGATYDGTDVNPGTVWAVVLGLVSKQCPTVVPKHLTKTLILAIYSHGDAHSTKASHSCGVSDRRSVDLMTSVGPPPKLDAAKTEWFAHLPYPTPPALCEELYAQVAVQGCRGGRTQAFCQLYASQLHALFARWFASQPAASPSTETSAGSVAPASSPAPSHTAGPPALVCLLNYCRSGGVLEALRKPAARAALGMDQWPLHVMVSCQPHHDALVGGLWQAVFDQLTQAMKQRRNKQEQQQQEQQRELQSSPSHASRARGPKSQESKSREPKLCPLQQQNLPPVSTESRLRVSLRATQGRQRVCTRASSSKLAVSDTLPSSSSSPAIPTLQALFFSALAQYRRENRFELKDHVFTLAYPSNFGRDDDTFPGDLDILLAAQHDGSPDWKGLQALQKRYRSGAQHGYPVYLWHPMDWEGPEASLVRAVKKAQTMVAVPDCEWGASDFKNATVDALF
eukprot:m.500428 g.500428  ORF g.500428 m.500428 type:complete len:548 (+) comp60758_c0_seq1:125-1768(+)